MSFDLSSAPTGDIPAYLEQARLVVSRLDRRLDELRSVDFDAVKGFGDPRLEALAEKVEGTIAKIFDRESDLYEWYAPDPVGFNTLGWSERGYFRETIVEAYREGVTRCIVRLEGLRDLLVEKIEDLECANRVAQHALLVKVEATGNSRSPSGRVFVVHGHDAGPKEAVARLMASLGLTPVILHEQRDQGRTIIEKLEANAKVDFAVVLLTPDDIGAAAKEPENRRPRARQNVILELGYFVGQLGRDRVFVLNAGVEIPSDYQGILYIQFDPDDHWKIRLAREMRRAGASIDLNQV